MCLVGFPSCLFCTIIMSIGRQYLSFVEEIILSLDWFLVRETYVKFVMILRSPYFLIHWLIDGGSTVCRCICRVSLWLLLLLTWSISVWLGLLTRSNWLTLPWHISIQLFIVPLVMMLFLFLLSFVSFHFWDIRGFLMGLFSSQRNLGLGNATSFFYDISQSRLTPHCWTDLI
jgi:hypothetical protein